MKNPPWVRDEIILALDLYFKIDPGRISTSSPEVVELSSLLNRLPIHTLRPDSERFRNPNGVLMKLMNLRAFDPDYPGSGLKAGSRLDKEVFEEFNTDRERLQKVAAAIRERVQIPKESREEALIELVDEEEFPEGRLLTRSHRVRERNPKAGKAKKAQVFKATGKLACEVCGFDFSQAYGELGEGFIECHHTIPLSELDGQAKTKTSDLALVCANCHRMLHRAKVWMSVNELKKTMIPGKRTKLLGLRNVYL